MKKLAYFFVVLFSFSLLSVDEYAVQVFDGGELPLFLDEIRKPNSFNIFISKEHIRKIGEKVMVIAPYALFVGGYMAYQYYNLPECLEESESCEQSENTMVNVGYSLLQFMGGSYLMANVCSSKVQAIIASIETNLPSFFQSDEGKQASIYMQKINKLYGQKLISDNNKKIATELYEKYLLHYKKNDKKSADYFFNCLKKLSSLPSETKKIEYAKIENSLDLLLETYSPSIQEKIRDLVQAIVTTSHSRSSKKTVICFVGEAGTGKTHLAQQLCKILGLSMTEFKTSGYKAVKNISQYISEADNELMLDLFTSELNNYKNNVLFLDEFDLCLDGENKNIFRNFFTQILETGQSIYFSGKIRNLHIDMSSMIVILACNKLPTDNAILSRINTCIMFSSISREDQMKIALNTFHQSIKNYSIDLIIPDDYEDVLSDIVEKNPFSGVRVLKEVVEQYAIYVAKKHIIKSAKIVPFNVEEIYQFIPFRDGGMSNTNSH